MSHAIDYFRSTLGKKVVMAVTGIIFFGYVVGHMLGNLQIYLGPDKINEYAAFLHDTPSLVWTVRVVLLVSVALHIITAAQVWLRNRAGRPVAYRRYQPPAVDYAARTMIISGPLIAIFVLYHLLHLTTGTVHSDFESLQVFHNVTVAFARPEVAAFYIIANLLLALHLYHGLWSLFQTLGWAHPRLNPWRRRFAVAFAVLVGAGNVSIPLSVLAGLVHSQ